MGTNIASQRYTLENEDANPYAVACDPGTTVPTAYAVCLLPSNCRKEGELKSVRRPQILSAEHTTSGRPPAIRRRDAEHIQQSAAAEYCITIWRQTAASKSPQTSPCSWSSALPGEQ